MTATAQPIPATATSGTAEGAAPDAVPLRVAVERFDEVPAAERCLERLREAGVPGHAVRLAANDVRTGKAARRAGYAEAAKAGLGQGGVFGALLGIFWSAAGYADEPMVLVGALLGAIAGGLLGLGVHWWELRSDASGIVEASSFDVLVDEQHADGARELLAGAGEGR